MSDDRGAATDGPPTQLPDHQLVEAPLPEAVADETRTPTRASGVWAAVVAGLVVLVVLIVFILENQKQVKISFFGASGRLPLGVALLLAAVIGGLLVTFAGMARLLELRRRARRARRAGAAPAGAPPRAEPG